MRKSFEQLRAPDAAGRLDVLLDESAQMLHVGAHALGRDAVDVDQLVVVAIDEVALHVEHVGESAGESRAEVDAGAPEHADDAARSCTRSNDRPAPSTTASAPELRTAKRSPAVPAAYSSPPVAPYRQVLPMITVSRATKLERRVRLQHDLAAPPCPCRRSRSPRPRDAGAGRRHSRRRSSGRPNP